MVRLRSDCVQIFNYDVKMGHHAKTNLNAFEKVLNILIINYFFLFYLLKTPDLSNNNQIWVRSIVIFTIKSIIQFPFSEFLSQFLHYVRI